MRIRCTVAAATVLISVSACNSTQPGTPVASNGQAETSTPSTEPTKSTAPNTDLPAHGAPKVASPLRTDKFEADPCSVFPQQKLTEYGVGKGEVTSDTFGKVCSWETAEAGGIELGWDTLVGGGLSRIYHKNKNKDYVFFNVLPDIEGFPAVSYGFMDNRKVGICTVSVGVSDDRSFMLTLGLSKSKRQTHDPCGVATTVAADAVKSMKAGA